LVKRTPSVILFAGLLAVLACTADTSDNNGVEGEAVLKDADTKTLRVAVYDERARSAGGRPEVWFRGAGSWYPDLRYGGDVRNFGGRRVGTVDTLFLYPRGRDAPELRILVEIAADLCPNGCDRDVLHIEISDNRAEAWARTLVGGPEAVFRW
jgi:hypothetical protein